MRKLQEIFDVVISSGVYRPDLASDAYHSKHMCYALHLAASLDIITQQEDYKAEHAIRRYLVSLGSWGHSTLFTTLESLGLPNSPEDLLAIYQNWSRRPRTKLKGISK